MNSIEIIENFLLPNSPCQINLSSKSTENLLEEYEKQKNEKEKWLYSFEPQELFSSIFRIVSSEIYHDPWKRFVRTKESEEIMKKYKHDSKIVSPFLTKVFSYNDEYFHHPFIFDRDFEFAEYLFKDNFQWELLGTEIEGKVNGYYSKYNYLPSVSFAKKIKCMKNECVISIQFQRLIMSYSTMKSLPKADPNTSNVECLEFLNYIELKKKFKENGWEDKLKSEREQVSSVFDISLPFPFDPRKSFNTQSYKYNSKEKSLIIIAKPSLSKEFEYFKLTEMKFKDKNGKIKNRKVYPMFTFMLLKYQQIDEEKVLFSLVTLMDLGGWGSSESMFKFIVKERTKKFRSSLQKLVNEFPKDAKFKDFEDQLIEMKDGKYVDGFGKLMIDLKIDEKNEEERLKELNKNYKIEDKEENKIQENENILLNEDEKTKEEMNIKLIEEEN